MSYHIAYDFEKAKSPVWTQLMTGSAIVVQVQGHVDMQCLCLSSWWQQCAVLTAWAVDSCPNPLHWTTYQGNQKDRSWSKINAQWWTECCKDSSLSYSTRATSLQASTKRRAVKFTAKAKCLTLHLLCSADLCQALSHHHLINHLNECLNELSSKQWLTFQLHSRAASLHNSDNTALKMCEISPS